MRDPVTGCTPKQTILAMEYVANGGNGTAAARKAYNVTSDNSAAVNGHLSLRKHNVRALIARLSEQHHATPSHAIARIGAALNAEREIITPKGEVLGKAEDWQTQLKAADMVCRIHGVYSGNGGQGGMHLHKHLHLARVAGNELSSGMDEDE